MDFETTFNDIKHFFDFRLKAYNVISCQCAYPRYRQIIAIDCVDTSDSFSCYETELLISLSRPYFNWSSDGTTPDSEWSCKKCGSTYSYEWADFSISVERQTVKLLDLKTIGIGKPALKPIPLYLGLSGHSFPPQSEIRRGLRQEFEAYMNDEY
ncbi:MAG: hypothetical protein ABJC12_01215 [Saprospiraceae bacterium]